MNKKNGLKSILPNINSGLSEIYNNNGWSKKKSLLHKAGLIYIMLHTLFFYFPSVMDGFNNLDQRVKYMIAFENMFFISLTVYYLVFFYKRKDKDIKKAA